MEWVGRLKQKRWVAHLIRTQERYTKRMGRQIGAGITYFSVLALVPLLMMAFSIAGFFVVELRPDLVQTVAALAASQLRAVDEQTQDQIEAWILSTLQNYSAIGLIGLGTAMYAGAAWMGSLSDAITVQWRADFDPDRQQPNIVAKTTTNLLRVFGLMVAIGVTFGLAAVSTNFADDVAGWLGLQSGPFLTWVFSTVPAVFSIGAGWLTFCYIFWVLPGPRKDWTVIRRGALIGSIGLGVLQYAASFLFGLFSINRAVAVFGPVIVLMLFFNLFATLILYVAAWIATYDSPALPDRAEARVRFALQPPGSQEQFDPQMVPQEVAVRAVRVGMGAGYVTGAAAGLGAGAVIAFLAARLGRRASGRVRGGERAGRPR